MKGLILSLIVFVLYVISTAVASHILKPKRHLKLFTVAAAAWTPLYFAVYVITPRDLGFIPPAWLVSDAVLDAVYGYAVLLLNCHSYGDYFYGFNGGFSMSMMLAIHEAGPNGMATDDVIAAYKREDGLDVIYGWRVPQLVEKGYVIMDEPGGTCRLTSKGRAVARFTWVLKRFLSLGAGG